MQKKYLAFLFLYFILCPLFASSFTQNISCKKINYLAGVIYSEACGEKYNGKKLVATVIWIRSNQDPENIYRVITLPKQFAHPKYNKDKEWDKCFELANKLYNDTFDPSTIVLKNGKKVMPDHFFSGKIPWWAKGKEYRIVEGLKFLELGSYRGKIHENSCF